MIEYYISCKNTTYQTEDVMRTENEEIRDHLKYLSLLARDYPSQAAAASEIISTQALLKLPIYFRTLEYIDWSTICERTLYFCCKG